MIKINVKNSVIFIVFKVNKFGYCDWVGKLGLSNKSNNFVGNVCNVFNNNGG